MTTTDAGRLAAARRLAKWELGYPDWADRILHAYQNPEDTHAEIDAKIAAYDAANVAAKRE